MLIAAVAFLATFGFFLEKNTTVAILVISVETMLLINLFAMVLSGVPAFLLALITSTILILTVDHFTN